LSPWIKIAAVLLGIASLGPVGFLIGSLLGSLFDDLFFPAIALMGVIVTALVFGALIIGLRRARARWVRHLLAALLVLLVVGYTAMGVGLLHAARTPIREGPPAIYDWSNHEVPEMW
jgi:cell shape-determining protein MreD